MTELNTSPVDRRRCGISRTTSSLSPNLSFLTSVAQFPPFYPPVSERFWLWRHLGQKGTSDAVEQRLSLFQRRLSSEGSNLEDSLCHLFRLLRGKLGKISQSLFCCYLEIVARAACNADIVLDEQARFRHCAQLLDLVWEILSLPVYLLGRPIRAVPDVSAGFVIGWAPWGQRRSECHRDVNVASEAVCLRWWTLDDSVTQMCVIPMDGQRTQTLKEAGNRHSWCVCVCVYFHVKVRFDVRQIRLRNDVSSQKYSYMIWLNVFQQIMVF